MIRIEDTLKDPEVKRHLLGVLESDLLPEQKYSAMVEFFSLVQEIEGKVLSAASEGASTDVTEPMELLSRTADDAGREHLNKVLKRTEDSAWRGIVRVLRSQHRDGGWGYKPEESNVWGTAHALLALQDSREIFHPTVFDVPKGYDRDQTIARGVQWMKNRALEWSGVDIPSGGTNSWYDASIAVLCLYRLGLQDFPPALATVGRFAAGQNSDGGYDANMYGPNCLSQRYVWSEVGATSMVLQTLAEVSSEHWHPVIRRGIDWLIQQQNDDGSWNNGSCGPGRARLDGQPTVAKTCDAIKGLLAGAKAKLMPARTVIDKAVDWVLAQEKIIRTIDGTVEGWGYSGPELPDLDTTCLALETLLGLESVSLPHLTANAIWLIRAQYEEDNSVEDGQWPFGFTSRITLGLIQFYKRIRENPAFSPQAGNGNPQ